MTGESNIGRIVKHAGFDTLGTGLSYVLMFGSSVIITRTIGAELFGKYSLSQSIYLIVGVFAVFGLNTGVVRLASKYFTKQDRSAVKGTLFSGMWLCVCFSVILLLVILALAPTLAGRIFKNVEGISWVLRIHILGLPFYALMMVINGYTQGFKTLKYSVIVEFITRPAVRLAIVVALFLVGLRLSAVLCASIGSFAVAALLAYHFARKVSPFSFNKVRTRLVTNELFFYSLPLVFARVMNVIIARSNTILVGSFRDSTATGLFGAAITLSPFISLSLISFGKIYAPIISELWENRNLSELESTFKTVSKWIFSIGFPLFLIFMLYSPPLLRIFGEDFSGAATTLRLLGLGQIVNAVVGPVGYVLAMTGRQKLNLVNSVVLAGVNVGLNIVMIPRWGIAGAGLATAISLALINVVRVVEVKLLYGFTPFRQDLVKPVLAGALAAAGFYLLNSVLGWQDIARTLVLCGAFVIVYGMLLYLFGLREEKEVLLEILRRRK